MESGSYQNLAPVYQNKYLEQTQGGDLTSYGPGYDKKAGIPSLREWRRITYRHKWLILSILLVALPFIAVQAYRAKSIYKATATIEVRPETSSIAGPLEGLVIPTYDNTKSGVVIIRSLPVLKKAILETKLDQNARFLEVNKKRSIFEALTAIKQSRANEKKEEAKGVVDDSAADAVAATRDDAGATPARPIQFESKAERERLAPYIQTLQDNLGVEGIRETRLLKLSFTHTDPDIAARVANGVASSYINYNFEGKTERFSNTSEWLEESTRKLKAQVEQAEQKLANYSRANNIFSLEGKENLTASKLTGLHDQVMRAETDRLLKQSLYEEVKRGHVAQLPEAFADPKTADLRKGLNELSVSAAQLNVKFGSKHPKLQEIRQQMAAIQDQIDANRVTLEEKLKADYERATRDEESLKAALGRAKSEAVVQNQASIQYSVLQQDLATAKTLYTDFLNKTSQASIQRAEQYNNVRLIEAAEPPGGPIGPNRPRTILLGLIASLAFGFGLAFLLEKLNTAIRNVEDVTRVTQLPTLAVIPTLSDDTLNGRRGSEPQLQGEDQSVEAAAVRSGKLVLSNSPKEFSAAAEAYRMLRTSVLLSTAGRPPRVILVTSGQPGDGKTTTAFNTAIAFTQLKSRVILVDCDMRKPRVHTLAGVSKGKGLSTLLSAGGDLSEFIRPSSVPYLSILPCGHIPPNPSELISSEKMRELLAILSDRFDYVILDSPPLVTVTDPIILSTLVDGVIVVTKSGKSKSEVLRRACHELSTVNAKILGVVLNDLDAKQEGDDYYYYYRYYSDYTDRGKPAPGVGA
jgi:polysaccharide biosynthesis transport protein